MATTAPETAPGTLTVNGLLDIYVKKGMGHLAPTTRENYDYHVGYLRKAFGDRIAADLKPRDFALYCDVEGRGKTARVRSLAVLSAAYTMAVSRLYLLDRSPIRDFKRPTFPPRRRLILDEEFVALRAMSPVRIQLAIDLAVLTGQRQGDIIRFKWSDIKEETVEGRKMSFLYVEQGKTKKQLAIAITPDLERVLDECWMLPRGGNAGSEYVLPTREGKPYTAPGFRSKWQRLRIKWERRGGKNAHFHDLRALAATKCRTLKEAQALLGHSTDAMTRRCYWMAVDRVQPLSMSVIQQPQA